MISDGLGTVVGSILGSPFGTVVYIGHPVHKRVGAQTGYSLFNGFIYLILCLTGVIPTILSLIPVIAIGPIIMIFGLMICEGTMLTSNPSVHLRYEEVYDLIACSSSSRSLPFCRMYQAYRRAPSFGNILRSIFWCHRLHLYSIW